MPKLPFAKPTAYQRRKGSVSASKKKLLETSSYFINHLSTQHKPYPWLMDKAWSLEIGFGNGEHLLQQASKQPNRCFLGIELYTAGICSLLHSIQSQGLENLFIIQGDATEVLTLLPDSMRFDRIDIPHPDPWPKKRQHKRRLVQLDFLRLCLQRLSANGCIKLLTDEPSYTEHMLACIDSLATAHCQVQSNCEPVTKYGHKAIQEGRSITSIVLSAKT